MYHITVKGGKFLEAVAQADTIVFDKTGTLTHACPVVARVIPFGGRSEDDMLRVAAAWRSTSRTPWRTPLSALRVSAICARGNALAG